MSENLAIIVLLGSRMEGQKLATTLRTAVNAAENGRLLLRGELAQRQIQLVEGYQKHRFLRKAFRSQDTLSNIEREVEDHIKNLRATTANVVAILFMCNHRNTTDFPFKDDTRFLGFSGPTLFNKLTVISSSPGHDLDRRLSSLVNKGLYVPSSESRPDALLPRILTKVSSDANIDEIYTRVAKIIRRHAKQATVLLVGHSGDGKSKTINRLLGRELLRVENTAVHGSTTKVIHRVKVHTTSKDPAATVTVAFDDTPRFEVTTYEDREFNETLMRRYKHEYLREMYPNVILLITSWNSINLDAHKEPPYLTSSIGKSMHSLCLSDLVDNERANVVVVVTKSLSSWVEYDDFQSTEDKNTQWRIDANRRRGIIAELQRKICPKSPQWETVFIENGGGRDMRAQFPILPDGLLSHQNVYNAIHNIIERQGPDGSHDLAGIQALQVLTGAQPLSSSSRAELEILLGPLSEGTIAPEPVGKNSLPPSPEERARELAASYLGVTYDVVRGTFGRASVLNLNDISLQLDTVRSQKLEFELMTDAYYQQQRSHRNSDGLDDERLRAHYSSDWAFRSALSAKSQCYILHHVIQVDSVDATRLQFSAEMKDQISRLPFWTPQSKQQYMQFFAKYGTHVVSKVALGGVLRVIDDSSTDGRGNVMIFSDGGGSVETELTLLLERHFPPSSNSTGWRQTSDKWIKELKKDPVFCPDHQLTEYQPIYVIPGLTGAQRKSLQAAYQFYVDKSPDREAPQTKHLPRESNRTNAINLWRDRVGSVMQAMGF